MPRAWRSAVQTSSGWDLIKQPRQKGQRSISGVVGILGLYFAVTGTFRIFWQ